MKNVLKGIGYLLPSLIFFILAGYLCLSSPVALGILKVEFYVFCGIVFAILLLTVLVTLFLCLRSALLYLFKLNITLRAPKKQ
jgi:hypothetical protein